MIYVLSAEGWNEAEAIRAEHPDAVVWWDINRIVVFTEEDISVPTIQDDMP